MAAAGNDDTDDLMYPAAYPTVIAVGATDWAGWESPCPIKIPVKTACFSNYGSYVDIAALGQGNLATFPGGGYAF